MSALVRKTIGISRMVQGKSGMRLQRKIALCGLVLTADLRMSESHGSKAKESTW